MSSPVQMDNGLDTYESDKEQEQAAERRALEDAIQLSMPSGLLAPSVESSDPASTTEAVEHATSNAGVSMHVIIAWRYHERVTTHSRQSSNEGCLAWMGKYVCAAASWMQA